MKPAKQTVALLLSIIISLVFYFLNPFSVGTNANIIVAIAALMVSLWVSEALPMPVVALLPLILFPLFNIAPIGTTASAYANPVIFLFMGGFFIALAIEKWNLHRRIALSIVRKTGTSGDHIIMGFIIATGALSMWLSNTATTMMMFPIALSVIQVIKDNNGETKQTANFSLCILLAIALASNIGGISTIIGTPPNVAYAAFIREHSDIEIDFFKWMLLCIPISILLLICLYLVMVKWLYPNRMEDSKETNDLIRNEVSALGKISTAEKRVLTIFICTALLWMMKGWINKELPVKLDDTIIALIGGISLFVFRSGDKQNSSLLQWQDTKNMAWGILILFGGGIALASALENAGLIQQLGMWFSQFAFNDLMLIFLVTFISLFVSEVMSNVAQVIVFAPVVTSLAEAAGMHPLTLGIPMTLAASCASMMPMGTPPNAIVFSSGYIKLNQMLRIGFVINIISILLITLFCWLVLPLIFNVN